MKKLNSQHNKYMTIKEQIDNAIAEQSDKIATAERAITVLRAFEAQYSDLCLMSARICIYGNFIDFNNPSRDDVRVILSRLSGGKWEKNVNMSGNSIDYVSEKEFAPGMKFRLWSAEPPPSCKMVSEEVAVPARIENRWKMVCSDAAALAAMSVV